MNKTTCSRSCQWNWDWMEWNEMKCSEVKWNVLNGNLHKPCVNAFCNLFALPNILEHLPCSWLPNSLITSLRIHAPSFHFHVTIVRMLLSSASFCWPSVTSHKKTENWASIGVDPWLRDYNETQCASGKSPITMYGSGNNDDNKWKAILPRNSTLYWASTALSQTQILPLQTSTSVYVECKCHPENAKWDL